MDYTLLRSRRKTVSLSVRPDGTVEVRAPLRLSKDSIDRFVEEKSPWIRERQQIAARLREEQAAFRLEDGALLPFLGRELTLKTGSTPRLEGDTLFLPGSDLKKEAEAFYRKSARRIFSEKLSFWGSRMGLSPKGLTITGAKTRWGSCSGKGRISFSWRLLRAPEEAVDYVVVHELAHLKELNHSKAFWAVVSAVFPDWQQRRALLRPIQYRLEAEGWN